MNSVTNYQNKNKTCFYFLVFISLTMVLPFITFAQNVDSLVKAMNNSKSIFEINDIKKHLPAHILKIDMKMLDVIVKMRMEEIKRTNISQHKVKERFSNQLFQIDDSGNIHAAVYMKDISLKSIDEIKAEGVKVEYINEHFKRLTCYIPFDIVEELSRNENILKIACIEKPFVNVGEYTSAGDGILNADDARTGFSINGQNVNVGVISDGVDHWTNSRAQGDLTSDLNIIHNDIGGDEGTAMCEIVQDIAPGATLYFNDAATSIDGFANHITELKNAGCKVIVDDIIYISEPAFEDGAIAQRVDEVSADGVIYFSACGNSGVSTWDGMSVDANSNMWQEFSGSGESIAINVPDGASLFVNLQWANQWLNSRDDFDLVVYDRADYTDPEARFVWSDDTQDGEGDTPIETVYWENHLGDRTFYIRVLHNSVQASRELKITVFSPTSAIQYTTDYGIYGHAASSSCISVGAINASSPESIASYSSHGPSRIYTYDANGNPVSYVDRSTPTICGIDGVETYVGMSGLWYPHPSNTVFYGTSAAAPHIAAISALMLSLNPLLNWQQTKDIMTASATKVSSMGGQNFTNAYGWGRVDAYLAGLLTLAYENKSQSSQPTTYNGQRKLYRAGRLHEVFSSGMVDGGEIFYRNSTDGGVNWNVTKRLSDGTTTSLAPCITMVNEESTVIVVWQQSNGSNFDVVFSRSTDGGSTWSAVTTLQSNFSCESPGPLPSVSGNNNSGSVIVTYRTSSGLRYVSSGNSMSSWSSSYAVPSTDGDCNSPTTAFNIIANPNIDKCDLAYSTDDTYYSEIYYNYFDFNPYDWSTATNLSSILTGYANHQKPNLVASWDPNIVHVVWEASVAPHPTPVVVHRKGYSGNFGSQYYAISSNYPSNPSISGLSSDNAWMVFQDSESGGFYKIKHYSSGGNWIWGSPTYVSSGADCNAQLSVGLANPKYIWTSGSSTPFTINIGTETLSKSNSLTFEYFRELNLIDSKTGSSISLKVQQPQVILSDGTISQIQFIEIPPDSIIISPNEIFNYGNTQSFVIPDNIDTVKLQYAVRTVKSENMLSDNETGSISFGIYDANSGTLINGISSQAIVSDTTNNEYQISLSRNNISDLINTNEIIIRPVFTGLEDSQDMIASLGHIFRYNTKSESELEKDLLVETNIPEEYLLGQNYPNPFNPTTTINYSISFAGKVNIKVFDLLGREIAELVNERKEAGNYNVSFNGNDLSSGVYFYTITANDFMMTKKMILMK